MPKIMFEFTRSNAKGGNTVQLHVLLHEIEVPGDRLTHIELRRAEEMFLRWFADNYSYNDLIKWVARSADGTRRYSQYECYVAVNAKP